ncbi:MAG: bifunctional DNA-formamidopyrimidine glycosylase/DNA-(apurinic or apyrimidinic site) lyase [Rhodovarius sp.]|nr:bifunctional DNA-formamidopyrimidine glycosylase/DNA-(apurinic or apyrimidinic site) lyase [Rhodovarius sp.]MDW8314119.1 bifunctional DNA-formamidopyrimidine glycosylase/DNA-(apurinic or apyrimidinic site) lyase [Rhodovarius sp.]
MPELPEVETVMRGLSAMLTGEVIARVELRRPDLRRPLPQDLARRLAGRRILGFRRRGKYMLMRLDSGESLLIHLGMSGRILARERGRAAPSARLGPQGAASDARGRNSPPEGHEHLVIETDRWRIALVDPRRFGMIDLLPTAEEDAHPLLRELGPEPLAEDFTAERLSAALAGRSCSIKSALLDQRLLAGLGNIYAAEALFRAGISPRRAARSVSGARAARLLAAIKAVLTEAIAAGGSSLRDYVRPDGEVGFFQDRFAVYDREGEPCPRCPGVPPCRGIRRIVQQGRSTFYCPRTQR